MLQLHIYPGGVKRILTFSFDDGFKTQGDRSIVLVKKDGAIRHRFLFCTAFRRVLFRIASLV